MFGMNKHFVWFWIVFREIHISVTRHSHGFSFRYISKSSFPPNSRTLWAHEAFAMHLYSKKLFLRLLRLCWRKFSLDCSGWCWNSQVVSCHSGKVGIIVHPVLLRKEMVSLIIIANWIVTLTFHQNSIFRIFGYSIVSFK